MNERSKTNKEIYEHLYPFEEVSQNPMICIEAIGYLKALTQYFPNEQKWAISEMSSLMLIVLCSSID